MGSEQFWISEITNKPFSLAFSQARKMPEATPFTAVLLRFYVEGTVFSNTITVCTF